MLVGEEVDNGKLIVDSLRSNEPAIRYLPSAIGLLRNFSAQEKDEASLTNGFSPGIVEAFILRFDGEWRFLFLLAFVAFGLAWQANFEDEEEMRMRTIYSPLVSQPQTSPRPGAGQLKDQL